MIEMNDTTFNCNYNTVALLALLGVVAITIVTISPLQLQQAQAGRCTSGGSIQCFTGTMLPPIEIRTVNAGKPQRS